MALVFALKKRGLALSGNANELAHGGGGPGKGSLSCLTVSPMFSGALCGRKAVWCARGRGDAPTTLESDRPARGLDGRHSASLFLEAFGALPLFREKANVVYMGKKKIKTLFFVTFRLSVLITASGLQGEKPLANGIK